MHQALAHILRDAVWPRSQSSWADHWEVPRSRGAFCQQEQEPCDWDEGTLLMMRSAPLTAACAPHTEPDRAGHEDPGKGHEGGHGHLPPHRHHRQALRLGSAA